MKSATEWSEQGAKGQGVPGSEISADQIRAALDKILASPGFITADRLTRFLRHVVEETLDGQTDKLKETLLGIDVFGRKPTYDPRMDAVVRTEAVKLRARLRDYYETEGRNDSVLIDIPKGGYVPAFRVREEPALPEPRLESTVEPIPDFTLPPWKTATAAVAMVLILAFSLWFAVRKGRGDGRAPELSSIAVLPFADLSPDHDQEYFCDGMTEEIIDALAKVGGFRVVARTSSFAFKGKHEDIREIGKQLNVGAVLEGSVRKFGNKLRVTAQLNSVSDGYHLWSETYERELKDVFSVQDEISQSIVDMLQLKLSNQRNTPRAKPNSEDLETYDLYLKGRYHWARWRTDGAEKAIGYFEQAIARNPGYAPAYAGLADSYCWLGFFSALPPNEAMPKAKRAAEKAIELDDSLAAAHDSLAYVKALYDFDWPGAQREFKRAIDLNPGLSSAHFGYGIVYYAPNGKVADALREMKLARDLDPLSLATNTYLGLAYEFDGKWDLAMAQYKKALELDPGFFEAEAHLAMVYCARGMFKDFYQQLDHAKGETPSCRVDLMRAMGDALLGKRDAALAALGRWERPASGVFVRPTSIAMVYAALKDHEKTIQWLQKAYADRDGMLAYAQRSGIYAPYRSDPRYRELMKNIGLSQAAQKSN